MMSTTVDSEGTQSLFVTPPVGLSVTNAQRSVIEISSHVKQKDGHQKSLFVVKQKRVPTYVS